MSDDNIITDFSKFAASMKEANAYTVAFSVGEDEYSFKYSELTSEEDIKGSKEFEKWFADKYGSEKDYGLSAALDGQWRVWKMMKAHMKGLSTFEDFLKLPTAVTAAMTRAIEKDLTKRYPHLVSS